MRFDAVIFDNDGLLLDTEEAWTRAEEVLFARRGRAFTIEHKRSLIGSSRAAAAAKLETMLERPGEGEPLMDELHGLVMEEVRSGVAPRPGAPALLEALKQAEVPVGLASNSPRAFVERSLAAAGLTNGHFGVIVVAEEVPAPKPAPDVYLAACRALGADPARSAALEDSPSGVAAGMAAGMFVVGVPYLPEMPLPGASLQAASLGDPEVLAALM
ncbi:MAG: HAD family phosphatase [Thermoleophilaceae bacterium]